MNCFFFNNDWIKKRKDQTLDHFSNKKISTPFLPTFFPKFCPWFFFVYEENLALYRLAVASSEQSADVAAARAVDGLFVTRWSPSVVESNPWLSVDLGEVKALSHVVLLWGGFYPNSHLEKWKNNCVGPSFFFSQFQVGHVWQNGKTLCWTNFFFPSFKLEMLNHFADILDCCNSFEL